MHFRLFVVRLLFASLAFGFIAPATVSAQTNPFADDAKKKKKKKRKSKKDREKEAEALNEAIGNASTGVTASTSAAYTTADEAAEEPEAETVFDDQMEEAPEVEQPEELPAGRMPIAANFSTIELIVDGLALGAGGALILLDGDLFGKTAPSMGSPEKGSLDYDLSIGFHGDLLEGEAYFFGISDIMGYTLIGAPLLWYGISAGVLWSGGDPMLDSQSVNIDHSLWGYIETLAWTAAATGLTKAVTGRDRPYKAFERPGYGDTNEEWQSSFFSTMAAFSFASAAYVSWDLTDNLIHKQKMGYLLGRVVPFTVLYGTATLASLGVMYQQEAFFTDVFVGAAVGSLIGNLVYVTHFDSKGDPNLRHPDALEKSESAQVTFTPTLIPTGDSVMMGAGAAGRW